MTQRKFEMSAASQSLGTTNHLHRKIEKIQAKILLTSTAEPLISKVTSTALIIFRKRSLLSITITELSINQRWMFSPIGTSQQSG